MKNISFAVLTREFKAGSEATLAKMTSFIGFVSGRIVALCNSLENGLPKYDDYVVKAFDTEKVKAELIDKSWDHIATSWCKVSNMLKAARGLGNDSMGKYEIQHASTVTLADRALSAAKTFISIVSTVTLILKTLPDKPKKKWGELLEEQKAKTANSNLPKNLQDYLDREIKKHTKK